METYMQNNPQNASIIIGVAAGLLISVFMGGV